MENKISDRKSTLHKTRYRRRTRQRQTLRYRYPDRAGNGQKGLAFARAESYGKSVCKRAEKEKRALLRLFAYAPVAARRRLFPFLRPMVRARVARKISSSVHEGGLRVVRRNR